MRIKRTKNPPPPSFVPPAVHYARAVANEGNVTEWTGEAALAGDFPADVAAKVKEFYRCRENAGTLTFEPAAAPELAAPEPAAPESPPVAPPPESSEPEQVQAPAPEPVLPTEPPAVPPAQAPRKRPTR